MVTLDFIRKFALSLPGVAEGVSYGTVSFKVDGKFMGRILEDGTSMSINIGPDERKAWCLASPSVFTVPEHFEKYDYMVINLDLAKESDVKTLLANAWERRATQSRLSH